MSDEILDLIDDDEDVVLVGSEEDIQEEEDDASEEDESQEEEEEEEEEEANPFEEQEEEEEDTDEGSDPLNLSEQLGEEYDSIDKVKEVISKYSGVSTTIKTLESDKKALEEKVNELSSRQPFKDKRFYQLDRLSEQDPDRAKLLQGYMFGNLSDEQIVKLKMRLDDPKAFDKNPGYLTRKFERDYGALFDEDIDKDDDAYKDALTDLELDAKAIGKSLQKEIDAIEVPENKVRTPEEIDEEQKAFVKSWNDGFKKVSESLTKVDIPLLDPKGKNAQVFSSIEFSEQEVKDVKLIAANFIIGNSLEPSEENVKIATEFARNKFIVENFARINTHLANKIASKEGQKWLKNVSNASKKTADVKGKKKKPSPSEISGEDAAFNEITQGQY